MKRYANLIRLNKWRVDQRRRHLAELETLAQEMRGRLDRMTAEIKAEQDLAHENKSVGHTFIAYAAAMNRRRDTIENSITNVAEQIVAAREEVAEAYRELKKYEIVEENRRRQSWQEEQRREQAVQDEIALNMYRRRG